MSELRLIPAAKSRTGGQWSADDYDVRHAGRAVGRIFRTDSTPAHSAWVWSLMITPQPPDCRGHEATREAAMAAFRARWVRATEKERASARR